MTHKERWETKTVKGSRRYATAQLVEFREVASQGCVRDGSVGDLLDRWFTAASPEWAPSTSRQTRSLIDHHLVPHLGEVLIRKLTTLQIDAFYGQLLEGDSGVGARRRSCAEARGNRERLWTVVPEQARDRAATHDGLDDCRESEAEDQRPENLPAHRAGDLERVHHGVG
jgi:hypothetical protein